MKLKNGQFVKVNLIKDSPDYGVVIDSKEVWFRIAEGNVAVKITQANSVGSKKGIRQFNKKIIENV